MSTTGAVHSCISNPCWICYPALKPKTLTGDFVQVVDDSYIPPNAVLTYAPNPRKEIRFTVYGTPVPQGSMKAFYNKRINRAIVTSDNTKLKPWRQEIAQMAMIQQAEKFDRTTPIEIALNFYFKRPKSASKKRTCPTVKPDADKLIRAVLDAITGILIDDDAQVVEIHARKHYGQERMELSIQEAIV